MTDESDVPMNETPADPPVPDEPGAASTGETATADTPAGAPGGLFGSRPAPTAPAGGGWYSSGEPTAPTPPAPPTPPTTEIPIADAPGSGSWPPPPGSQAPNTWGSAPQGWPPPPIPPIAPPAPGYGEAPASPYTQAPPPPFSQDPSQPYAPPGGPPPGMATPPPGIASPPPGIGGPPPRVGPPGGSWSYSYGPATWGPPPGTSSPPNAARRAIAVVAVVVLVLASAAVGAAVSSAMHSNSTNNSANSPLSGGNGGFNFGGSNSGGGGSNTGGLGTGTGTNSGSTAQAPAAIVAKVDPAVVDIYTTIDTGSSQGEAAGTGMVLTSSGEILTNNHVIDGASKIRVQIVETGKSYTASVLGYSVVDDVALLQMQDPPSNLHTVSVETSSSPGVGDSVVAIGNAGGRGGLPAATAGSVTALDQKVTAGDEGTGDSETLHGMIQISAPIEPGDSGGPLVNSSGKIVGMNTAAAQSDDFFGQSGSSTAFAIPIDHALTVVHQIESGKDSSTVHIGQRGILGVQVRNAGANGQADPSSSGAAIAGVQSGGPADSAGLANGDVITSVNGKSVSNASDLTAEMFSFHPGDKVEIKWVDTSGDQHSSTLKLVSGPPT